MFVFGTIEDRPSIIRTCCTIYSTCLYTWEHPNRCLLSRHDHDNYLHYGIWSQHPLFHLCFSLRSTHHCKVTHGVFCRDSFSCTRFTWDNNGLVLVKPAKWNSNLQLLKDTLTDWHPQLITWYCFVNQCPYICIVLLSYSIIQGKFCLFYFHPFRPRTYKANSNCVLTIFTYM